MSTRDITLRWDDPNMIEKGHKVYRSKTPMDINNMPEPIAVLGKNSTEYIDVGQTIGDTNYYRVSAWIDGHEIFSEEAIILVQSISVPTLAYMETMTDSSYLSIGFEPLLEGNSTISMWVYPKNLSSGGTSARQTIYVGVGPIWNTGLWASLDMTRAHINGEYLDYSPISNYMWHNITIIYGTNTIDRYFINGNELTSTGGRTSYAQPKPSYYMIGAEDNTGSKLWQGHIKNFLVYDYPLSTQEVMELYNNKPF